MKNQKRLRFFRRLALAVFVVCLFLIGQSYVQSFRHRAQQDDLKAMTETGGVSQQTDDGTRRTGDTAQQTDDEVRRTGDTAQQTDDAARRTENTAGPAQQTDGGGTPDRAQGTPASAEPVMLEKYIGLYAENTDLVGWLSIDDMKIDYPVMQNEDDEYYLHHGFYGDESRYGCLYVREEADLDDGTNFVIYGHNMKDGSMFGELDLYLEEGFYEEHPVISFDTLYEERAYEIVAVFRSQVYGEEDDIFKYYQFYKADTVGEFDDFYDNIKALSLYDTGVEAQFGDTFLTLSTCAYHVKDGRLVVVAKRVS